MTSAPKPHIASFTFGEATPVLNQYELIYSGLAAFGEKFFVPPIDMSGLAKLYRATAHHGSALQFKRNLLKRYFIPHPLLSRQAFEVLAQDYLIFGNCYLEVVRSALGTPQKLLPARARYVRRGLDMTSYFWESARYEIHPFSHGSIVHLMQPDINQEVYGVPDYLGALQSVLLNEAATLFRRRYYENGSHAGFILYVTGQEQNLEDIDAMREALRGAKGPGNFRNLFLHVPDGQKDGVQLIPFSDVKASDDFASLKDVSRDDQLAGHRIPPQLLGLVPSNNGGFGDIAKASQVFVENEIVPIMETMAELNSMIGQDVITFQPTPSQVQAAAS